MDQPFDTQAALFGEIIALRSIVGTLVAICGDQFGNRPALIKDIIGVAEDCIDRMDIADADPARAERIKALAHRSLQQTVGLLRGSPGRP